jgi:hypothetical protein
MITSLTCSHFYNSTPTKNSPSFAGQREINIQTEVIREALVIKIMWSGFEFKMKENRLGLERFQLPIFLLVFTGIE